MDMYVYAHALFTRSHDSSMWSPPRPNVQTLQTKKFASWTFETYSIVYKQVESHFPSSFKVLVYEYYSLVMLSLSRPDPDSAIFLERGI